MEVKAVGKNIGVSRIKARIPADVVRNMNAQEAVAVLTYMPKGAALHVKKVIESAIANARNNYNLNPDSLFVSEIKIDKGPIAKFNVRRGIYKAKGRFATFNRQYCHITVVLKERESEVVPGAKKAKKEVKEEAEVEKNNGAEEKKASKGNTKKSK